MQLQTVEQHVRRAVKRLLLDVDACTAGAAVTSADSFGVISAAVVAVADAVKRHVRLATLQRRLTATASMMEGADQAGAGPTGSRAGGDHDGDVTSVWRSMKSEVRRLTAVVSDERCQQVPHAVCCSASPSCPVVSFVPPHGICIAHEL